MEKMISVIAILGHLPFPSELTLLFPITLSLLCILCHFVGKEGEEEIEEEGE